MNSRRSVTTRWRSRYSNSTWRTTPNGANDSTMPVWPGPASPSAVPTTTRSAPTSRCGSWAWRTTSWPSNVPGVGLRNAGRSVPFRPGRLHRQGSHAERVEVGRREHAGGGRARGPMRREVGCRVSESLRVLLPQHGRRRSPFVKAVGHPNCGMMYDTFHSHIEEKSIPAAIRKLKDCLVHVHISENDRIDARNRATSAGRRTSTPCTRSATTTSWSSRPSAWPWRSSCRHKDLAEDVQDRAAVGRRRPELHEDRSRQAVGRVGWKHGRRRECRRSTGGGRTGTPVRTRRTGRVGTINGGLCRVARWRRRTARQGRCGRNRRFCGRERRIGGRAASFSPAKGPSEGVSVRGDPGGDEPALSHLAAGYFGGDAVRGRPAESSPVAPTGGVPVVFLFTPDNIITLSFSILILAPLPYPD